jgi:hypothetical protein
MFRLFLTGDYLFVTRILTFTLSLALGRPPNPCEYLAVFLLKNMNAGKTGKE